MIDFFLYYFKIYEKIQNIKYLDNPIANILNSIIEEMNRVNIYICKIIILNFLKNIKQKLLMLLLLTLLINKLIFLYKLLNY